MDLAQIRKKAKQAKNEVPEEVLPSKAPVEVAASNPFEPEIPAAPEPVPAAHFDELSEPAFEEAEPSADYDWDDGVIAAPALAEDPLPPTAERFDPVALIVSGREAAREGNDAVYTTETDDRAGIREFLCFRIAREEYAIDIMEIKEIIKPRDVTEVPRSPDFISGIISLRGLILPVFDIALRLGFVKDCCTGKERVVVVRCGEGYCGIMVDEVSQVVRLAEESLEPPPPVLDGIDRDFVTGIGRQGERMLILLNMDKVLDINVR
jgi:purine-binding chemotaxis protein CheW